MGKLKTAIVLIIFILQALSVSVCAQIVNKVVAVVNEEVITQQDVERLIAILYAQYVQEYKAGELLEKMEEAKRDILNQMIEDKLILSHAKELGINVTETEIMDKLSYIKNGFPSEDAFYETLRAQGITLADLKNRYRDQILMKKAVDIEVSSKVSVLLSEIREYYESHRQEFKLSEKCRVRHILIKANDEVGLGLAKVEIEDIYAKLKEGRDFAQVAMEHSQGPNSENGGDMGYVGRGEMIRELEDVIFKLSPGEFSQPVKSHLGYHIIKVEDIMDSGYIPFDEAQENIRKFLLEAQLKERLEEWLDRLRREAYIEIK